MAFLVCDQMRQGPGINLSTEVMRKNQSDRLADSTQLIILSSAGGTIDEQQRKAGGHTR